MLSPSRRSAFAKAQLKTFDLSAFEWDPQRACSAIQDSLNTAFCELNTTEVKQDRLEHFKIPGTSPEDYSERIISLGQNRNLICGIRHKGGQVHLPFIQITPDFELTESQLNTLYTQHLKKDFAIFNPLYIQFWSKQKRPYCLTGSTYLVSKCQHISEREPWPYEDELSLENIEDESYYAAYQKGYAEFHTAQAHLKDKVTLNSKEIMAVSLNDGLLKSILFKGKKIGLIAAEKNAFLGHRGIYFNEIFLHTEFRGRHLARAIQRKFVSLLLDKQDFVWGTIDDQNLPSYKTALANGRLPVRFECFYSIQLE